MKQITEIGINLLQPHPDNALYYGELSEPDVYADLKSSIQEIGLQQPIVVRLMPNTLYQIVAGERRWRACRDLGIETVPCIVRQFSSEDEVRLVLLHTNKQRVKTPAQIAAEVEGLAEIANRIAELRQSRKQPEQLAALEAESEISPDETFSKRDFIMKSTGLSQDKAKKLIALTDKTYKESELEKFRRMGANPEQMEWIRSIFSDAIYAYKTGQMSEKAAFEDMKARLAAAEETIRGHAQMLRKTKAATEKVKPIKHTSNNCAAFVSDFLTAEKIDALREAIAEQRASEVFALFEQCAWEFSLRINPK